MSKRKCKCEECSFNGIWVFMRGCPLALIEACDGVKKFKPKKEVQEDDGRGIRLSN